MEVPRTTGPAPECQKCPPRDAPDADFGSLSVLRPFLTPFREHGSMGVENLAGQDTVLGGQLSTFTGQSGP